MDSIIAGTIDFVGTHRAWAFWIALVFATAETTAFLSILIPSTAILVGVGAFVATGELSFTPIFLGAAVGAVIGSTFSWFLGVIYGERILQIWPLKDHPDLVRQATATFARWGPLAILLGHFFGPLRPVAFLMCGISLMPFWRFQLYNVAGAVGWAYVIPKFGEVSGIVIGWLWNLLFGV
jgi:membrane protein DedA with SNARE-associated domain